MLLMWVMLLWWRPAISHHSFLLIFRRSLTEALRASDISPVPSLNLQPNTRGGTADTVTSSPYKLLGATQKKRKSNRPINPKPVSLRRMLFLVFQKDGRGFAEIQLRLTLRQIRTLTELFLSLTIRHKRRNRTLIVCTVLVISLKTTMEGSGYNVRNISDGRTNCVLVWRKILFVSRIRDKHCFVLSLCRLCIF